MSKASQPRPGVRGQPSDAALFGALSAFARPPLPSPVAKRGPVKVPGISRPSTAVSPVQSHHAAAPSPRHGSPHHSQPARPQQQRSNTFAPAQTSGPRRVVAAESASPSSIAARTAALSTHRGTGGLGQSVTAPSSPTGPGERPGATQEQEDYFPAVGTVTEVKKWLQTLGQGDAFADITPPSSSQRSPLSDDLNRPTPSVDLRELPPPLSPATSNASQPPSTVQLGLHEPLEMAVPDPATAASINPKLRLSPRSQPVSADGQHDLPFRRPSIPGRFHSASPLSAAAAVANEPGAERSKPARLPRITTRPASPTSAAAWSPRRIDSLATAMVASHLASSRAPSPARARGPAPPLARHHTDGPLHHFRPRRDAARTPSPAKPPAPAKPPMRTTMRKEPSSSDDPDPPPRARKKWLHPHPHKHHEGDRRRWRDAITDRERKRYEGLWAANRGLHLRGAPAAPDAAAAAAAAARVAAPVVRDVWARSRLPLHALEEVWALVDRGAAGALARDEFVVGLWLIDQWLRGRKLPPRVSEHVWKSALGLQWLNVPVYKP